MSVRAKMRVVSATKREDGEGGSVRLEPVISGSPENAEFYRWTPGGVVELNTINIQAFDQFAVGKEYYVDFTPATS